MKNFTLTIVLFALCSVLITLAGIVITVGEKIEPMIALQIVTLINAPLIGLFAYFHSGMVQLKLLQDQIKIMELQQDERYEELKKEIDELKTAAVATKISASLKNRRR